MLLSPIVHVPTPIKARLRPAVYRFRELPVHAQRILHRGRGPIAVFLPSSRPEGAALLRIYGIAKGLRGLGWRSLVLPWRLTLSQRLRFLARAGPDLVVMQGARHELNRPKLYPGQKILFDMDDADFHLPFLKEPIVEAMPQVKAVLAGSQYIAEWCRSAGAPAAHVLWTGGPVSPRAPVEHIKRPPVIAWAQSRPMTYTREADWVRRVVKQIGAQRPGVILRLYDRSPGDDPSFADSFRTEGVHVEWYPSQGYRGYLRSLEDVSLGFAPLASDSPFSRGKSFGKILAYLDRRVPVFASDMGEPARFFTAETGLVSNDPAVWGEQATEFLDQPALRQRVSDAAFVAYQSQLSIEASVTRVDRILRDYIT